MIHRFLLAARPKNPLHHGLLPVAVVLAISGTSCTPEMKDAATASERSPLEVSRQSKLVSSDRTPGDSLGSGVSIDSDTAAVGAFLAPVGGLPQAGAVYVFVRDGTNWTQEAYLKASNTDGSDQFGYSVSLSGDTLAVGASREDSNGTGVNSATQADNSAFNSGAVYVFLRSATDWSQQAYIKASNTSANDWFGLSLDLSADGDTLAVGAMYEDSIASGIDGSCDHCLFAGVFLGWSDASEHAL